MKRKIALIGSGGFANEVKGYLGNSDIISFVDDLYYFPNENNIFPLSSFDHENFEVLIAIGDPKVRKIIVEKLPPETKYFTYVHPTAQIIGKDVEIGEGSIICPGVIITTNCKIGKHAQINITSTIGHDCNIGDFFTTAPAVNISGNCEIGNCVYLGTNSSIKQKIKICDNVVIGLNSGVVKNIEISGTYIGTPARIL